MRLGLLTAPGAEITVDDLTTLSMGCGGATTKLPTPMSLTPSTPSFAVTRMVQPPITGDAGTVYAYCSTQVADVSRPQPAAAPCAVMVWALTRVTLLGSTMLSVALVMSKLPNGSLTVARTYTVLPGLNVDCCTPVFQAWVQVCTLLTLMTVALLRSTRE